MNRVEMWLKIFLIFWAIHLNPFKCSLVIDRSAQEGIYLNDYCPKMPFCPEGAHTMCIYYNPNRVHGPRCSSFQNISVNAEIAEHLLEMVNEMRGRVAMGKETGKGNVSLPRGYGMFQLKWDNELATFAQVLANTCIARRDLCRATKRFSDPGQLVSLVRFTIPDWLPVSHQKTFTEKGLTTSKISYATNEGYKVWYRDKQHVSLEMIQEAPDWMTSQSTEGRLFLQLVDGKATHMGCGVSAYVEYKFQGNNPYQIIFNSVHIVCNLSSQPRKGTAVYRTDKPTAEDLCPPGDVKCIKRYKSKCGCPPDTAEDDRCLCTDPIPFRENKSCAKDKSCKPAVVLLPIFTVEDAPPHKLSRKGMSENVKTNPTYNEGPPDASNEWDHNEVLEKYRRKIELDYDHKPVTPDATPSCDHKKHVLMDGSQQSSYIMNSIEPPYTRKRVEHLNEHQSDEENDRLRNKQTRQESFTETNHNIRDQPYHREPYNEEQDSTRNHLIHREYQNEKNRRESFEEKYNSKRNQPNHQESFEEEYENIRNTKKYHQDQKKQRKSYDEPRSEISPPPTQRQQPKNEGIISSRRYTKNKQSIFSRAPRFELHNTGKQIKNVVKMDVAPRKDFSNAKQALDKYLNEKRQKDSTTTVNNDVQNEEKDPAAHDEVQNVDQNIDDIKPDTDKGTVTIRPRYKSSLIRSRNRRKKFFDHNNITKMTTKRPSMKQYLKNKFRYLGFNINDEALNQVDDNNEIKESDRKLMSLLDNLEQEAQHVDLDGNKKEIFDAKFKKIYGSIAKKKGAIATNAHKNDFSAEMLSNSKDKKRHDLSLRYESDYDEAMFYENTDDPNKDEFDKQIYYDAEDVIADFHSKDHDLASQSLYARPLPRDQNTLRPILEDKMDYVFRNTLNVGDEFKSKLSKNQKRKNRHSMSRFLEDKKRNEDEVKSLPYKVQYGKKNKRQKYTGLNKFKDRQKKYRQDDENGRHINQIDEQRERYDEEIMSDYEDDKQIHFNNKNNKPYGKEYEKDYPEDPLSAERRRFYQEKLDKLKRRKYSPDPDKPGYTHDIGKKRRLLRGLHGASASRRYYLPNRASRHRF